jgi:mannose/cellobiose epimerase-like protein (N-acyl-D-glucosamine 2-epimerase family)
MVAIYSVSRLLSSFQMFIAGRPDPDGRWMRRSMASGQMIDDDDEWKNLSDLHYLASAMRITKRMRSASLG